MYVLFSFPSLCPALSSAWESSAGNFSNHFRRSAVGEYAAGDVIQNQGSCPHDRVGADSEPPTDDRPDFHGSCLLDNDPPAQMCTCINPSAVCDGTLMIYARASGNDHIFAKSRIRINY